MFIQCAPRSTCEFPVTHTEPVRGRSAKGRTAGPEQLITGPWFGLTTDWECSLSAGDVALLDRGISAVRGRPVTAPAGSARHSGLPLDLALSNSNAASHFSFTGDRSRQRTPARWCDKATTTGLSRLTSADRFDR